MRHNIDNKKIIDLYQSNVKIREIIKESGCDIYRRLKKMKIPLRRANLPEKWGKIKNLYESGLYPIEIAKIIGYSKQGVDAILRKLSVKRRKRIQVQGQKFCPICNELKFNREFSKRSKQCRICAKNRIRPKKERISYGEYFSILKPNHPRADKNGYVKEHIVIWEEFYNKPLPNNYVIHHINGNKKDNYIENLLALTLSKHHSLLSPYKKRIRELEAEVAKLRQQILI